jgi:hypothetical protein
MVQREYGVEPLGLFRFAGASFDGLMALLESRLSFASNPSELASIAKLIRTSEDEYITSIEQYEFVSHTFTPQNCEDFDRIRKREAERLILLSRKLLDDLEDANKIFVYKSDPTASRAKIDALSAALRGFGPNSLLWVTPEEKGKPRGFVEELSEGLMRGYIDRFALYDGSLEISRAVWGTVCENAHAIWLRRRGPKAVH